MPDVSIAVSARNNFSREFQKMSSDAEAFNKDLEMLNREVQELGRKKASLKTDLDGAKKELREAQKGLDGTADAVDRLQKAHLNVDNIQDSLRDVSTAAKQAQRDLAGADSQVSKSRNGGASAGGIGGLINQIGKAGAYQMIGDAAGQIAGTLISSAYGSNVGTMFDSVLGSAGAGAAIGSMILPGAGTVVGAIGGGLVGAAQGATQIFTKKDDAFKDYVQTSTEDQLAAQGESLSKGSVLAGKRETDLVSFTTLFDKNKDVAEQYLSDVRNLANSTPFLYDDLTSMSKVLKTYGFQTGHMIPTLTKIGDTGAALGMGTQDMSAIATALGRMYMGGNATREDLDILNDRGVNAVQYLADGYGVDYSSMLKKISGGEVIGQRAVEIILEGMQASFEGSMQNQSTTFEGLSSTLEGWGQEMDAAMGEGFNATRKQGLQAQINWLSSDQGKTMQDANAAVGAWKAELENSKEQYVRDAVDAMMSSEEYKSAKAEGDAAEMGKLIMQAKTQGMNEYNASEGAQLALESELALAGAIRDDAASNSSYYDAGLRKGEEYSRGLAESIAAATAKAAADLRTVADNSAAEAAKAAKAAKVAKAGVAIKSAEQQFGDTWNKAQALTKNKPSRSPGKAFGLLRVPEDDYPVRLHAGERVLTANQARQMDGGGSPASGIQITIPGMVVREDADIKRLAAEMVSELQIAMAAKKS